VKTNEEESMKKKLFLSVLSILSLYIGAQKPLYAESVQLKVYVEGEGGSVREDGGFTCSSEAVCLREISPESVLTLTAEASEGYLFTGWDSDCGTEASCRIEVSEDTVLIAHFIPMPRLERADQVSSTPEPTLNNAQTATSAPRDRSSGEGKPDLPVSPGLSSVSSLHSEADPVSNTSSISGSTSTSK